MGKTDFNNQIYPGHHAYLIAGNSDEILPGLISFLEKSWKIEINNNPDLIVHRYPTLYIENLRDFEKETLTKPLGGTKKVFIVSFDFVTRETANAMLKLFEEPIDQVVFFAITPNPERLPETLRSRFFDVRTPRIARNVNYLEAEQFLKKSLGQRFDYSKKLAADISDGKRDRGEALAVLEAIEEIVLENNKLNRKIGPLFEKLEKYRSYLKDQSSSVKMLFDSVAIAIEERAEQ